jgi:Bacterial PH domain
MQNEVPAGRRVSPVSESLPLGADSVPIYKPGARPVTIPSLRVSSWYGEDIMGLISKLLGHASDLTPDQARQELDGVLLPDEPVQVAFKVVRDLFVFTDRRLVLVDKQSLTGRKVEYLIIPYRAITSYSIENAGTFDMDSELKIWVSGRADPIQKVLKSGANIRGIQAAIASAL